MQESFFGEYYQDFKELESSAVRKLESISKENNGLIEHIYSRIKTEESTKEKLARYGFSVTRKASINDIYDVVGIRVICQFIDDVFILEDKIKNSEYFKVFEIKDYINNPKNNGYRSLHMLSKVSVNDKTLPIEIQIRTISQDSWASLEHKLKYKKDIKNKNIIEKELKRCADELASTDINMQTIKDLINSDFN